MSTLHSGSSAEGVIRSWAENPKRAVIFDFNGTLSDDEPILLQIYAEMFLEHFDWTMTEDYYRRYLLGHSDREIVASVVAERGRGDSLLTDRLMTRRRRRYRELVRERSPISAGATALVRLLSLAKVPLAIVTGAERGDVRSVLDNCEVGRLIELLVSEEDVARGKPDPEGFLKGAELLGRNPRDVLVFEDSLPGVLGAHRAGMTCLAVVDAMSPPSVAEAASAAIPQLSDRLFSHISL